MAQHTVFTTHTPVPAGHDRFDGGLIEEHLGPLRDRLGISLEQLMGLGRVEPQNEGETFCMTVLALKMSRRANAVSCLHGHVSRRMWAHLWPWRVEEEIPIGHITNGVHVPQLAGLANAAALRPQLPGQLVPADGRARGLASTSTRSIRANCGKPTTR